MQVLCNLATLQQVSLGATGGHSSDGGAWPPGHPLEPSLRRRRRRRLSVTLWNVAKRCILEFMLANKFIK